MVGFDEGEGVNYLTDKSAAIDWDNAIINLINANYKTDQARNYIQQFVRFQGRRRICCKTRQR